MDLSIIIVNWNSVGYLRKCLASIYENAAELDLEVIVVDNASFDGWDEMLRESYPAVRAIQSVENLGFAGANNLCFRHSRGNTILFLNPDTEVVGGAIQSMLGVLKDMPDAGIAGATLLNSDQSIQTSCIQRFPTILNQVLDSDWLRERFPLSSLWGTAPLMSGSDPVTVEVVSGACLMIRRNVFEVIRGFDEGYFMYSEDVDLCYRVSEQKYKCYYVPNAVVVHHGGRSSAASHESHFAALGIRESLVRFLRIRRGRAYAATYRLAMTGVSLVRLCLLAGSSITGQYRLAEQRRLSLAKWTKLLRWAIGLEKWTKQLSETRKSSP